MHSVNAHFKILIHNNHIRRQGKAGKRQTTHNSDIIIRNMQILFIRHADPDYTIDSLTPEGELQAKALADYLEGVKIDRVFCSTLGRARKTASYTLERKGLEARYLPWLQEFRGKCEKPNTPGVSEYCWDWLPADWTKEPLFYDKNRWFNAPAFKGTNVKTEAQWVTKELDNLLSELGYKRTKEIYQAVRPNTETVAVFCHLGVQCIMLGHLLGISPMVLLHGLAPSPSSITTVATEERAEGKAFFRVLEMGAVPHLRTAGLEPSFAARFCECYYITEQRH